MRRLGRKGVALFAMSAFDVALWDIKRKIAGLPLHKLLGGNTVHVPAYGSGGWLSCSREKLTAEAPEYVKNGLRRSK